MKGAVETGVEEETFSYGLIIIYAVLLIAIVAILGDRFFNQGKLTRTILCGLLFWLPGGAITQIITGGCAAIPV